MNFPVLVTHTSARYKGMVVRFDNETTCEVVIKGTGEWCTHRVGRVHTDWSPASSTAWKRYYHSSNTTITI